MEERERERLKVPAKIPQALGTPAGKFGPQQNGNCEIGSMFFVSEITFGLAVSRKGGQSLPLKKIVTDS
jgi:hypothetical protein